MLARSTGSGAPNAWAVDADGPGRVSWLLLRARDHLPPPNRNEKKPNCWRGWYSAARTRRGGCGAAGAAAATAVASAGADPRCATMGVIGRSVVATTGSLPNGATVRRGLAKSSARPAGTGIASPCLVHRFLGTDHSRRIHVIQDGLYPGF